MFVPLPPSVRFRPATEGFAPPPTETEKLGTVGPEAAMGIVTPEGKATLTPEVMVKLPEAWIVALSANERAEIAITSPKTETLEAPPSDELRVALACVNVWVPLKRACAVAWSVEEKTLTELELKVVVVVFAVVSTDRPPVTSIRGTNAAPFVGALPTRTSVVTVEPLSKVLTPMARNSSPPDTRAASMTIRGSSNSIESRRNRRPARLAGVVERVALVSRWRGRREDMVRIPGCVVKVRTSRPKAHAEASTIRDAREASRGRTRGRGVGRDQDVATSRWSRARLSGSAG